MKESVMVCLDLNLKKRSQNLISNIFISILDNSLFIFQEKSFEKSNVIFFCSYNIISSLFKQFILIIKHSKSELFHFFKSTKNLNSSSLDLGCLRGPVLWSKDT